MNDLTVIAIICGWLGLFGNYREIQERFSTYAWLCNVFVLVDRMYFNKLKHFKKKINTCNQFFLSKHEFSFVHKSSLPLTV